MHYSDGDGREFIIPPGTHCYIVTYGTIKPGETQPLFSWKLDECCEGCVGLCPQQAALARDLHDHWPLQAGERREQREGLRLLRTASCFVVHDLSFGREDPPSEKGLLTIRARMTDGEGAEVPFCKSSRNPTTAS